MFCLFVQSKPSKITAIEAVHAVFLRIYDFDLWMMDIKEMEFR